MAIQVRVQNFQSIKDATLMLDGFTAITGPNNTGKSAFLRALQGLFKNTRGSSFVRHGAAHCTVCITFEDGVSVTWEKGKNVNRYRIGTEDWLEKVAHGVPEPVVDVLRVHAVEIGSTTVWPQLGEQFSGQVFLLDRPGSVLAEAISDVEKVGRLNKALTVAESDRRKVRSKLQLRKQDEDAVQTSLLTFRGLEDVEKEVAKLVTLQGQAIQAKNLLTELTGIQTVLKKERAVLASLEGVSAISLPSADEVQDTQKVLQKLHFLVEAQGKLVQSKKYLQDVTKACASLSNVDLGGSEEEEARKALASITLLQKMREDLASAKRDIEQLERESQESSVELQVTLEEFQGILKEMPSCPTCGNVLGGIHAH